MSFEPWQIRKILGRVEIFREKMGTAGKRMTVAKLYLKMQKSPLDKAFFEEPDEGQPDNPLFFRYERLRRFVTGGEIPSDAKIGAVRDFLIHEGMLTGEELTNDAGDFGEQLAIHGYLADGSPQARTVFSAIKDGVYIGLPFTRQSLPRIELHFICDRENMQISVEERYFDDDFVKIPDKRTRYRAGEVNIRRGYGFLSTTHFLLHIFLKGENCRDRVHYVQATGIVSDGSPFLIRIGGSEPLTGNLSPPTYPPEDYMPFFNVCRFKHSNPDTGEPEPPFLAPHMMAFQGPIPDLAWGVLPNGRRDSLEFSNRLLIRAVKAHSFGDTRIALEGGANPNFQDEDGMTALHHAAASNSRKCLRLLIKNDLCDYLLKDNKVRYASDLAIEWGNDHAVYRLLYLKRAKQAAALGRPSRC